MIITAVEYPDPPYLVTSIIECVEIYIENNTDTNISTFLQQNMKFLSYFVKTLPQEHSENIDIIMNILTNITALDMKYDTNDILYNFYQSTNLVNILTTMLSSPTITQSFMSSITSLLSNIALSENKT